MCGLAGVLEFDPQRSPAQEGLDRMARALFHRGPDDQGILRLGPVGLAHRRLSIIDLVTGRQPMGETRDAVWLAFNGEIYNFPELKHLLEARGHSFQTRSDTEVLLRLYLEYGLEAFPRLNGMFACAFWDGRTQALVLARDRLGKKPLFYHTEGKRFLFGSEIKAILAYGGVDRRVHRGALQEYLTYSYLSGEQTIYEGIHRLLPGHLLVVRQGRLTMRPYWALQFGPAAERLDEREAEEQLELLLRQCVRRRLMSDVPLGAFLSGGIDSSTVVALMAQCLDRPVKTFSVGFEEAGFSELEDARTVARCFGTEHHETIVRPSALEVLPDLVWHLDEPFGDSSSVPTYYVCRAAREGVTVALSGDGGDEVFAGYTRYLGIDRHRRGAAAPAWLRKGIAGPLARILPIEAPAYNYLYSLAHWSPRGRPGAMGFFPYVREKLLEPGLLAVPPAQATFEASAGFWSAADALDPVSRFQYLDTLFYLPGDILAKVDRMSMAVSLEVRCPFLDFELVEFVARLPASYKLRGGVTKYLLRRIMARHLPASVLRKRKQGFAIPQGAWFRRDLRQASEELLLAPQSLARGYFRPAALKRILQHHRTGARDYSTWIWCLVMLEMWHRVFLDPATRRV